MQGFDLSLYRWEHTYFLENFVKLFCRIEFDSDTVEKLEDGDKTLIHRDFQSQNVLIHNDEPAVIDFQGLRFGSPFYDLGSLLYDPYVVFTEEQRMELLAYYYKLSIKRYNWEKFIEMFRMASIQRLMQALGAYGFLGLKKGIKSFLDSIPAGLRNLGSAASNAASLPSLQELCQACQSAIEHTHFRKM